MHFKMGITEFEGDSSLLASPFWNHAEVLTDPYLYCCKTLFWHAGALQERDHIFLGMQVSLALQAPRLKHWLEIWKLLLQSLFLAASTGKLHCRHV